MTIDYFNSNWSDEGSNTASWRTAPLDDVVATAPLRPEYPSQPGRFDTIIHYPGNSDQGEREDEYGLQMPGGLPV